MPQVSLLRPGIPQTNSHWKPCSPLCHPEEPTCLRQVERGMNMGKRCLPSRPRGPAPKISPARKAWVHRQAVERRRCGTTLLVCSLGAKPTCPGAPWRDLQFPYRVATKPNHKQNCYPGRSGPVPASRGGNNNYFRGSTISKFFWCINDTSTLAVCNPSHCSLVIGKLKIVSP